MALEDNAPDVSENKKTGLTYQGKEITLAKLRGHPYTGLVKKGMEKGIYPEEVKLQAATIYAATGSLSKAAELSKVPEAKLRDWRKTDWFQGYLRDIWTENNEKIDAKFTEIIEKSLNQVLDRLDNGDYVLDKNNELIRKPISAKELSLVQAINVDKRQLLRGLPTSRSESMATEGEKSVTRLEKLAETFENLAKYGRQPKQIEGEVIHADVETAETVLQGQETSPSQEEIVISDAVQS